MKYADVLKKIEDHKNNEGYRVVFEVVKKTSYGCAPICTRDSFPDVSEPLFTTADEAWAAAHQFAIADKNAINIYVAAGRTGTGIVKTIGYTTMLNPSSYYNTNLPPYA